MNNMNKIMVYDKKDIEDEIYKPFQLLPKDFYYIYFCGHSVDICNKSHIKYYIGETKY